MELTRYEDPVIHTSPFTINFEGFGEYSGSFEHGFRERYQRNNKRSGRKNLRCFPLCHKDGHKQSQFCGRKVAIQFFPKQANSWNAARVVFAVATFCKDDDINSFTKGRKYNRKSLEGDVRSHGDPCKQYIPCQVEPIDGGAPGAFRVTVNDLQMGWHYRWKSNKHLSHQKHVLLVHLFSNFSGLQANYMGSVYTPAFNIYCRRRPPKNRSSNAAAIALVSAASHLTHVSAPRARKKQRVEHPNSPRKRERFTTGVPSCADISNPVGVTPLLMQTMNFVCFARKPLPLASTSASSNDSGSTQMDRLTYSVVGAFAYDKKKVSTPSSSSCRNIDTDEDEEFSKLRKYLLEDDTLAKKMDDFFSNLAQQESMPSQAEAMKLFPEFVSLVGMHVMQYLASQNMDMNDLKKLVKEELERRIAVMKHDVATVRQSFQSERFNGEVARSAYITFYSRLHSMMPKSQSGGDENADTSIPLEVKTFAACLRSQANPNGKWCAVNGLPGGELPVDFVQQLGNVGLPVFIFKVLKSMYLTITLTLSDSALTVEGTRKLLSTACHTYVLNAQRQAFHTQQIVPFGLSMIGRTYIAWVDLVSLSIEIHLLVDIPFPLLLPRKLHGKVLVIHRSFRFSPSTPNNMNLISEVGLLDHNMNDVSQMEVVATTSQVYARTPT